MIEFWFSLFIVGFAVATVAYFVALKVGLMAIVDTIWTTGLGVSAITFHLLSGLDSLRSWVVLSVVIFWSFRLSFHLFKDRVFAGHEDPRYKALSEHWGSQSKRNFYFLFLVQIPFIALFLFPISIAMQNPTEGWHVFDTLAIAVALLALLGEYIADKQLAAFRSNPENKGGVCQNGLWRYSRHPNYFFEWLHWFAYLLFAIGSAHAWMALVGPVAMYVFLRFLTGVPYAERSSLKSRGEAYREYQRTTSPFFPWIPQN